MWRTIRLRAGRDEVAGGIFGLKGRFLQPRPQGLGAEHDTMSALKGPFGGWPGSESLLQSDNHGLNRGPRPSAWASRNGPSGRMPQGTRLLNITRLSRLLRWPRPSATDRKSRRR